MDEIFFASSTYNFLHKDLELDSECSLKEIVYKFKAY